MPLWNKPLKTDGFGRDLMRSGHLRFTDGLWQTSGLSTPKTNGGVGKNERRVPRGVVDRLGPLPGRVL